MGLRTLTLAGPTLGFERFEWPAVPCLVTRALLRNLSWKILGSAMMVDGTVYDGIPNRPLYFDQKEMRFSVLCNREWCRSTTQWALHVSMDRCLRLFFKHFKASGQPLDSSQRQLQELHDTSGRFMAPTVFGTYVQICPVVFASLQSVESFSCWFSWEDNIKITMLQLQLHICFLLGILSRTFIK